MSIDLAVLKELKEIMEEDFDELILTFIADGQIQLDNLRKAIDASAADDIKRIAHTIKGSSANIGAMELSEAGRILEFNAAGMQFDAADEYYEDIKREYEAVKTALAENF